jgi:hypothetical protein
MKGPKLLPKKITSKMNKRETTKYERLQKEWIKTGGDMVKAQAESVDYGREIDKIENPTATMRMKDKALVTKGFKTEEKAFKKADEYDEYKKKMEEKYQ